MKKNTQNSLLSLFKKLPKNSIGNDIIWVDNIHSIPFFNYPVKSEVTIATLCLSGYIEVEINMKNYRFKKNNLFIILQNQIVQYHYTSEDFSAIVILMSGKFLENFNLNVKDSASAYIYLKDSPALSLSPEEFAFLLNCFDILRKIIEMKNNRYQLEMARSLLQTFFYGTNSFLLNNQCNDTTKSRGEVHFEKFYEAVLKYHKYSRALAFYAEKLHLNPKYLTTIIKRATGKTAIEWINDYIIWEAKSLLKGTDMTIQEISIDLGFPNQSFFGKYFKQHTGLSPKNYRRY